MVAERDQVLQLLSGLRADYNPIVASLAVCEDDVNIYSMHSILLTHEQKLNLQTSMVEDKVISTHIATQGRPRNHQNGRHNSSFHKQNNSQRQGRTGGRGQDPRTNHTGNRP